MVGFAGDHRRSLGHLCDLCNIAGVPEQVLRRRAARLAVLFTVSGGELRGGQLQTADHRRMVEALARAARATYSVGHPVDVLLLPQGLLPLLLAVPPGVRRGGATQEIFR